MVAGPEPHLDRILAGGVGLDRVGHVAGQAGGIVHSARIDHVEVGDRMQAQGVGAGLLDMAGAAGHAAQPRAPGEHRRGVAQQAHLEHRVGAVHVGHVGVGDRHAGVVGRVGGLHHQHRGGGAEPGGGGEGAVLIVNPGEG